MTQLAGIAVAGQVHTTTDSDQVQLKVELHTVEGTAVLVLIPVGPTNLPAYELPVDGLKVAIAALPMKELLRVAREVRS